MATSLFHTLSVRAESLTHNEAVRSILADIPMFAVGIFTLGAFTLLLFLRRVNWVLGCLHGAIFVAFIAALLDLVELICRGQHQADDPSVNQNPLLGLTIAREIGYALSFGLRFVFFWGYAGCAPPKTKPARMHSGRWERWGLLGHILRWSILVAIVAITSLQVVYRLYTPLKQIDTIHQIGGVVEASVSAVIILKLLLNVYLANLDSAGTTSRLRVLLWYSPMVIALGLSLGIGAANVIESMFSESILGRLLQGIELYIASLFILVVTCDPLNEEAMKEPPSRLNRSSSFQGLSPMGVRLSGFQMGPPRISLAPVPALQMPPDDAKLREGYSNSRRPSYATRLSTWVSSRRISFRSDLPHSPGLDRLWDQDRAERGSSPVGETKGSRMSHETFPAEPKQSPAYPDPVYTSILRESQTDDKLDVADPVLPLASPVASQELLQAPRALTPSSTDSPIHTLHGVVQPLQRRPTKASTAASEAKTDIDDPRRFFDDSARSSGISGLLRQQEELDKSIAALKLFSSENNRDTRSSIDAPTPKAASEFSLSNFPEPPWGRASVATVDSAATVRQGPTPPAIVETEEPIVVEDPERDREQSLPVTEDGIREILRTTRGVRSESGGTQYEITSFIGGLTRPGHAAQASMSSMGSARRAPAPVQPMPTGSSSLPSPERPQRPKVSLDIPASVTESPSADSPLTRVSPSAPLSQPRVIGLPARPKPKTGSAASSPIASSLRSQRTDNFIPTPF